jgi:hypothetical protein
MSSQSRQPENIFHSAFWLIAGEDVGASASRQNRKQSRVRAGVRGVAIKALHNSG